MQWRQDFWYNTGQAGGRESRCAVKQVVGGMKMAVTETETIGWGSRLGGSIKGVLFGLGLFVLGFPVRASP